jgi:hypothetical protein
VNNRLFALLAAAAIFLCAGTAAWAQDAPPDSPPAAAPETPKEQPKEPPPQYALGDQTLSINAGLFIPLFFLDYQFGAAPTNLTLGGAGSLNWMAYVTSSIRVGIEVGGMFAFSPNMNVLLAVPLTAKASYVFAAYPFEIPVSLGVGMNIVKYIDASTIDLLLKPAVSGLWAFNADWSFGVNLAWWWSMQFSNPAAEGRIGNFLEISLCALYHY